MFTLKYSLLIKRTPSQALRLKNPLRDDQLRHPSLTTFVQVRFTTGTNNNLLRLALSVKSKLKSESLEGLSRLRRGINCNYEDRE